MTEAVSRLTDEIDCGIFPDWGIKYPEVSSSRAGMPKINSDVLMFFPNYCIMVSIEVQGVFPWLERH